MRLNETKGGEREVLKAQHSWGGLWENNHGQRNEKTSAVLCFKRNALFQKCCWRGTVVRDFAFI